MNFNKDAFSSGQVGSKIWLCQELEKLDWSSNITRIYGGWYGVLAFLLLSREKFKVRSIRSYDIDSECEPRADTLNENWVYREWTFKSFTADCNQLAWDESVDLIINTSTEHFHSMKWWHDIPYGTRVILQSNNMPHDDHVFNCKNEGDFLEKFPLSNISYIGTKEFVYPEWKFERYMLIGIK